MKGFFSRLKAGFTKKRRTILSFLMILAGMAAV